MKRKRWAKGAENGNWKGGKVNRVGYVYTRAPDHPNCQKDGYIAEHTLIAEKAIGHLLRKTARLHHLNGIKTDNRNSNLVVCDNHGYHMLLHKRTRALRACGNASFLKCSYCKKWDSPENIKVTPNGKNMSHTACMSEYNWRYRSEHPKNKAQEL